MASARSNFLTKRLNVWVNAIQAWMDMRKWDKCADPELKLEQFLGQDAIAAVDLATKRDIACKGLLFEKEVGGKRHFYAFLKHYLPEAACSEDVNASYIGWKDEGWLTTTPGDVTDFDVIERDLEADCKRFNVLEAPFDPFHATQFASHMIEKGVPMVELRGTTMHLSQPMKELDALVAEGRFHHNGDPVLTWMVGNVIAQPRPGENIYPRKEAEEKKIDGAVTIIMALARALARPDNSPPSEVLVV